MAETRPPVRRAFPWRVILFGSAALALALFIGTQVIGVLYSIIAPPPPPLPQGTVLLEHSSSDYGVDEWLYSINQDACAIIHFYQIHDTDCLPAAGNCEGDTSTPGDLRDPNQEAECVGERQFSIFAMQWKVMIVSGDQTASTTQFRLSREIFWTGSVPPEAPMLP